MELEERDALRSISLSEPSPSQFPIGRVMGVLLASRHRHLEAAVRRLGVAPSCSASGSLVDESLCFLWRHVQGAVEKGEDLNDVLVPMIEHSLAFKEPKHSKQVMTLIGWLFRDECFARSILNCLVEILKSKKDHFVALGWCKLVIAMIEVLFNVDFDNGKQEQEIAWLKILWQSISDLSFIICNESTQIDGFELPTRLVAASADCMLVLFESLMRCSTFFSSSAPGKGRTDLSENRLVLSEFSPKNRKGHKSIKSQSHHSVNMETGHLLWSGLDQLIVLIQKLKAWSQKSQPLHAKGLEQLAKWVQGTKLHYDSLRVEAGNDTLESGILLLCSCWKHYGRLLRLNDVRYLLEHKEILEQLLAALQRVLHQQQVDLSFHAILPCNFDVIEEGLVSVVTGYASRRVGFVILHLFTFSILEGAMPKFYTNQESAHNGDMNGAIETRKFFLNCIALLLGRLHGKHLQAATSGFAHDLLPILFAQLQDNDEDLAEEAVGIIRGTLFVNDLSPRNYLVDAYQMEHQLSLLVKCLNEHDRPAMAIVQLTAECCFLYPEGQGFEMIIECFEKGNGFQKRNALKVVSAIICLDSRKALPSLVRKRISEIMIQCLQAGLVSHNAEVLKLFPQLDATVVLPELLHLVCSENENVKSPASEALLAVLRYDFKDFSIFFMTLDYVSNYSQIWNGSEGPSTTTYANYAPSSTGLKMDVSQVLSLLLRSTENIEDWTLLIDKLIDRMFADPSNAIIVRLVSHFSDFLADVADLVFHRVLMYMHSEQELDKKWFIDKQDSTSADDSFPRTKNSLFNRLCPLLLLRVLPLRAYDNLSSSDLYDHMSDRNVQDTYNCRDDCIAEILFARAFGSFEFEDVRKLATELCGRLHPQVLLPVVANHLDDAIKKQDILKIKTCLFALCTSLVARGMTFSFKQYVTQIRSAIDLVLSWPSFESDEVSRAQHGCIDCLALLICSELSPLESSVRNDSKSPTTEGTEEGGSISNNTSRSSTVEMVIQRLICGEVSAIPLKSKSFSTLEEVTAGAIQNGGAAPDASSIIPFRLCMANVLISAYQKVPDYDKSMLSSKTLPALISGVEEVTVSEVRAACLQVLFSAVYNLKATVLPFAFDLLKLAMKALKHGLEMEKIAATKLMASLMASDAEILSSISGGLLEAKSILSHVSSTTSSPELRKLCRQLMSCMISPLYS